jgi:hypothetical protein
MRARGSKSGVKNKTPKLPETQEYLGKIGIFLLLNSDQRLSDFFNGFPIFLNGFPLSKKSGKIYLWRQV